MFNGDPNPNPNHYVEFPEGVSLSSFNSHYKENQSDHTLNVAYFNEILS